MFRIFKFIAAVLISAHYVMAVHAAEQRATPDEAKAMLSKAVAYFKANGKDKAFAEFMNKQGSFVDRDLYVTAYDMDGKTLAHGANPRLVGKDNINLQDASGRFHIKERLEMAKTKGKGQQEFSFLNPMTKQIEPKLMFFERVNDVIVACGSYKP